jgi:NAD(P)H dehydrogenase (quinone)
MMALVTEENQGGDTVILVTGASGALGRHVMARLGADATPGSRTPPDGGRRVDFTAPATLASGFAGVDVLLLISAGAAERDEVISRHDAAISAAEVAGVRHIVYTSICAGGEHTGMGLPHRWTEARLARGTASWTVLRNGLYAQLLAWYTTLRDSGGALALPLGTGGVAAVTHEDLADITAKVLRNPGPHAGRTYELVGEVAVYGDDLASVTGAAYHPTTLAATRTRLEAAGMPGWQVEYALSTFGAVAAGHFNRTDDGTLNRLLGRKPTPALQVIAGLARTPEEAVPVRPKSSHRHGW